MRIDAVKAALPSRKLSMKTSFRLSVKAAKRRMTAISTRRSKRIELADLQRRADALHA